MFENVTTDEHAVPRFLRGGGSMGAYFRSLNWETTAVGHPDTWPPALRTAISLILNSNHPMYVFWGLTGTCFYNDAYSHSIGPERHPGSIGQPAEQVWAEIWHIIGPQIAQVMSGGPATWHENALVPITRNGCREDVYWTYSYGPINDDTVANGVGGVLVICTETTEAIRLQRRMTFQVEIDEAMRSSRDLTEILTKTTALLGQYLSVRRCGLAMVNLQDSTVGIYHDWTSDPMPQLAGTMDLSKFALGREADLKCGQMLRLNDIRDVRPAEPLMASKSVWDQVRAAILAPLLRNGDLVAVFYVHQDTPTIWTDDDGTLVRQIAERIRSLLERTQAEEALLLTSRELAESVSQIQMIAEAMPNHVWVANPEGYLHWFNKRVYEFSGAGEGELDGAGWTRLVHPDDISEAAEHWSHSVASGDDYETQFRLKRADGVWKWHLARAVLLRSPDGQALRWIGTNTDIDEQRRISHELIKSDRRYRLSQKAAGIASMEVDVATDRIYGSPDLWNMFGLKYEDGAPATDFEACVIAEDQLSSSSIDSRKHGVSDLSTEYRIKRADTGELRWITRHMEFVRDEHGAPTKMYGALRDITSEKTAEVRQKMLTEELEHRIKNILATVQAIASQTLRNSDLATARAALSSRLKALGEVHSLLSHTNWSSARLAEVVASASVALPSDQISAAGPDVKVGPKRALSMALAVNELGTNSLKYGALSVPEGRVQIEWRKETTEAGLDRLRWTWTEIGGPAVSPPTRSGFGRFLVEKVMAQDFSGVVRIDFAPTGVECVMVAPWPEDNSGH